MNRFIGAFLVTLAVAFPSAPLLAQGSASPALAACSLLPKEDVKRHLPWIDLLDFMVPEEEAIGVFGSSCNYPSVFIQVLPSSSNMLEQVRGMSGVEPISDVGDEAYFHNNNDRYAELLVKAGNHLLTIQANVNDTIDSVKPGVLSLAKALIAELP